MWSPNLTRTGGRIVIISNGTRVYPFICMFSPKCSHDLLCNFLLWKYFGLPKTWDVGTHAFVKHAAPPKPVFFNLNTPFQQKEVRDPVRYFSKLYENQQQDMRGPKQCSCGGKDAFVEGRVRAPCRYSTTLCCPSSRNGKTAVLPVVRAHWAQARSSRGCKAGI